MGLAPSGGRSWACIEFLFSGFGSCRKVWRGVFGVSVLLGFIAFSGPGFRLYEREFVKHSAEREVWWLCLICELPLSVPCCVAVKATCRIVALSVESRAGGGRAERKSGTLWTLSVFSG